MITDRASDFDFFLALCSVNFPVFDRTSDLAFDSISVLKSVSALVSACSFLFVDALTDFTFALDSVLDLSVNLTEIEFVAVSRGEIDIESGLEVDNVL